MQIHYCLFYGQHFDFSIFVYKILNYRDFHSNSLVFFKN